MTYFTEHLHFYSTYMIITFKINNFYLKQTKQARTEVESWIQRVL